VPRQSKAALSIAHIGPRRLEPPPELAGIEAEIFRQTVASVAPDHFQAEDLTLLCAYARAAALERRAAEELAAGAVVGNAPSPWLTVHATMTKTMMQLSVRLRIGPKSRAPSNNRRRSAQSGTPSYYEIMNLGGSHAEDRSRGIATGAADSEGREQTTDHGETKR
jgi:phage terminase small subunit